MAPAESRFALRQLLAAAGAMLAFGPVWILQFLLVSRLDPAGYANAPGWEPLNHDFCCCLSALFILAVFLPISLAPRCSSSTACVGVSGHPQWPWAPSTVASWSSSWLSTC
jgi:hypothetical protein